MYQECAKYFVEEPTSAKSNFSEKHIDHENGKESSQEAKDSVKYDKDIKVPTNEDFNETFLQEHQFDDLQQVPYRIDPGHSHKMDENVVLDIKNNPCSLRKGHEAGDQQTGKEGENAEMIMPDIYCNDSVNIPVYLTQEKGNAPPVEIKIQNELHSLQEVCEAGEPEVGNEKENPSIDMPYMGCNDGADIQDNLSQEDNDGDNASPSKAQRRNFNLKTKPKKFDLCMPAQEQESTKCENENNYGTQCNIKVSPRIVRSNLSFSQTMSRSKNKTKHNKQGTLYNRMDTKLSSSVGNCNRCDLADLPQTNEGMNQFDKGIRREQNWEDRDPKDIPGNRFSDCVQKKDVSLNSNDYEKQISNKAENTNAFGEQQTEEHTSMKKRKSQPDPKQIPTNGKHHPAKKKVKSQAAWLRRPSHRFHEYEVECLIAAVEKFGTGRWKDIKEKYFSTFQFRTAADLKDKWRSLLHSAANLADNQKFRATVPVNLLKRVLAVQEKV